MKLSSLVLLILFLYIPDSAAAPLRVGVSLPLSGPAATYGADIRRILDFLNAKGPKFDLIYEDDRCDPREAVSIAQKFVSSDHVQAVLGMPCSGTVISSASVYDRAKVPVIGIGPGAPSISGLSRYVFRTRPSDKGAACLVAKRVAERHKTVSLIAEQTEFAQALANVFLENAGLPSTSVMRADYLSSDSDFKSALLQARPNKSEALVIFSQAEPTLARMVKAARELQVAAPIYSATFPGSPSFLKVAGPDADGIIFAMLAPRALMLTAEGLALLTEFESHSGPLNTVDYTFAVTETALSALKQASDRGDIVEHLRSARFNGSIGQFSFDGKGDLVGMHYVVQKVEGGRTHPIESPARFKDCD